MAYALRSSREPEPVRITTAPVSADDDRRHRQRRYMISMGIRTLCFVVAVLVGPGWFRWVMVAASLLLPYYAVVMANSAAPRLHEADLTPAGEYRRELE